MKHQRTLTVMPRLMCAAAIFGLVATGCSSQQDAGYGSTPPADPTVTATPQASPTDVQDETTTEPVGDFSTDRYESDTWPSWDDTHGIYPVNVRSAVHDGFERVVIEHAGTGQPSFFTQYTAEPREPGIGTLIDTGSEAYLEVTLSGTTDPLDLPPDMLEHGAHLEDLDTQATEAVVSFAPWEATSTYYLGLDQQRPYAVSVLESPVRVVIDIQLEDQ